MSKGKLDIRWIDVHPAGVVWTGPNIRFWRSILAIAANDDLTIDQALALCLQVSLAALLGRDPSAALALLERQMLDRIDLLFGDVDDDL